MSLTYISLHNSSISLKEEENNLDPDDRNSRLCNACTLPIFSTPFQPHDGGELFLHDECAVLPKEVFGHSLHRQGKLILVEKTISNINSFSSCRNCHRKCGSIYRCSVFWCHFKLDVLCAFPIKILHRSHEHRLTVINPGSASIICGACDTRHEENLAPAALFYFCNLCQFWIHSDCASLPNAINLMHHRQHSFFLTYGLPDRSKYECAICSGVIRSLGVYFCAGCRYFAHIHCAKSKSFESVRIQDAKLAGLLHFPLKENTSVMRYISENTASSSADDRDQTEGKLVRQVLHQHPLILDEQIDGGDESITPRVCSACVQLISPPFYSCSECPDFFLHNCCANLPTQIKHYTHQHPLSLLPKAPNSSVSGFFYCRGCVDLSNRFAYSCNTCDSFNIDVVCALLPPAITHELHGNTHVLYMSPDLFWTRHCKCCGYIGGIFYECSACHDFIIHAQCAMFPSSIKHKYDEHPLKLTTDNDGEQICEICEDIISGDTWYYSCRECEQSFHHYCIPSVNGCSRIKLGGTIHVDRHDCPLTLVLESTLYRYHCGYCSEALIKGEGYDDRPAYECSKCYFRIHDDCAAECLRKCSETQKSISMI